MKAYSIFFPLILLLLPCALKSAETDSFSPPRSLKPEEYVPDHDISSKEAPRRLSLFVQFTHLTNRWQAGIVPMPEGKILSCFGSYEIKGYFDQNGAYFKIPTEKISVITSHRGIITAQDTGLNNPFLKK